MEKPPLIFPFHNSIDKSMKTALETRRPILTHLNADTSWLVQLPCPREHYLRTGKSRYNIVIDPWFQGSQVDIAACFSKQWHAIQSTVQTFQELQAQLRTLERISNAGEIAHETHEGSDGRASPDNSMIDAVIISHEFTDHCHKETLLELDPAIPIFATTEAAAMIKSWAHFKTVSEIPILAPRDADWNSLTIEPLPDWLGVSRIVSKSDPLYLHSAILLTFKLDPSGSHAATSINRNCEALVYTPHGIKAQSLRQINSSKPTITVLALLHGLHQVILNPVMELNLGAHNGLEAQRVCHAKYWISTHDEVKKESGLVALLLKRNAISLDEAMEQEQRAVDGGIESDATPVTCAELSSGESVLLE
jgi:hypothetical protein